MSEELYLQLLQKILIEGTFHRNRTGVNTIRLPGQVLQVDLSEGFPLLTTKKMNFNHIAHELLWFLSGSSDISYLHENGIHIWDKDWEKFKERTDGVWDTELGFLYGPNWRDFNGFDQLSWAEEQIKTNPSSRQIVVSAWRPDKVTNLRMCALPPCHVVHRYWVDGNTLNLTMYQRSCDMFLGVPYNIASYGLLLSLMCFTTSYQPGKCIFFFDDCHIYENHIDAVETQCKRSVYAPPLLVVAPERKVESIVDFKREDFFLSNYHSHPAIRAELNV